MKVSMGILLAVASIATGCGKKSSTRTSYSTSYFRLSENPILLSKQVKSCPRVQTQSTNKLFNVNLLINGQKEIRTLDLAKTLRGQRLQSSHRNLINSTEYNYSDLSSYKMSYNFSLDRWQVANVPYDIKRLSSGEDVLICPGQTNYSENSIESAAMTTNFIIQKTKEAVSQAASHLDIAPVDVKITPLYKVHYIGTIGSKRYVEPKFKTDNAFYRPSDNTIQFLPQSKEAIADGAFGGTPLWQIPMVASHEYGHHIFAQTYPKYLSYYPKNITHGNCFDSSGHALHEHTESFMRTPNEVDNIRALNEGFADLIANYSLASDETSLSGVTCMQVNREITSDSFGDGTLKVFTREVNENMHSYFPNKSDDNCNTPNFQSIHIIGAIFAYATDTVLSRYTNNNGEKLRILLKWLENMNKYHLDIKKAGIKNQFGASFSLLLMTVSGEFPHIGLDPACSIAKDLYPGYEFKSNIDNRSFVDCR